MLSKSRRGQGLVEYALIIMMVALVVILVLYIFGPGLAQYYSKIVTGI